MTTIGSEQRPLRVAIVGAGPSGFFSAAALLASESTVRVDLFERVPTPFGLVRFGVAPDHARIKRVRKAYDRSLAHSHVRYFGNSDVGRDVSIEHLTDLYDAVLISIGASSDRKLGIPGEELAGSWSATEFVGWYNGHPDFQDRDFALSTLRQVVVVGVGNVAVDVARILVRDPDELHPTDMTSHSVDRLRSAPIEGVVMLGRRGAAQAKFSPSEIKELAGLEGVRLQASEETRGVDSLSEEWLAGQDDRNFRKNADFIGDLPHPDGSTGRAVTLNFLTSPVEILGDAEGRVRGVRVRRNRLEQSDSGPPRPVGTDETWEIECQAVFRSVGYRGVALPGVPFDDRKAVIPNRDGRVLSAADGVIVPGLYTAGWIKRGPSGLIGTNKADAQETVAALMSDLLGRVAEADPEWDRRSAEFIEARVPNLFRASDWQELDSAEVAAGVSRGKTREKAVSVAQMLRRGSGNLDET